MEGFSLANLKRQWPLATKPPANPSPFGQRGFVLGELVFGEFLEFCSRYGSFTF